jgi:hypothetical protein
MRFPPSVVEAQHGWALERYGQSATSALDEWLVIAFREVSDVGESAGFVVA